MEQVKKRKYLRLTSENLVQEKFNMVRAQALWRYDDFMKVTLIQLCQYMSTKSV